MVSLLQKEPRESVSQVCWRSKVISELDLRWSIEKKSAKRC